MTKKTPLVTLSWIPASSRPGNVPIPHPCTAQEQGSFPAGIIPGTNHSQGRLSHLDGLGPFCHGTGVVNTQHMLAWKLIIIFGSHQLPVIGSPSAERAGSGGVEIPTLPGSAETNPGKGEGGSGCPGMGTGKIPGKVRRAPCVFHLLGKPGKGANPSRSGPGWEVQQPWNGLGGKRL